MPAYRSRSRPGPTSRGSSCTSAGSACWTTSRSSPAWTGWRGRSRRPDAYLLACDELGVDPARSVALEDSAHGVAAAKAAGLRVVAVPSSITRFTDLTAADLTVTSLEDVDLDLLAGLVAPA